MSQKIKKIYVDFDGVIIDTIKAVTTLYNEDFQYYKDFQHVNWWDINTYAFEECTCASSIYLEKYFTQPRFFEIAEFMPWCRNILDELSERYEIIVVSHGEYPNLIQKRLWLMKKLPYARFIGVDVSSYSNKNHIDMSDGYFLDDHIKNLINCNAYKPICFGDVYSWNNDWQGKRVCNWVEFKKMVLEDEKSSID